MSFQENLILIRGIPTARTSSPLLVIDPVVDHLSSSSLLERAAMLDSYATRLRGHGKEKRARIAEQAALSCFINADNRQGRSAWGSREQDRINRPPLPR